MEKGQGETVYILYAGHEKNIKINHKMPAGFYATFHAKLIRSISSPCCAEFLQREAFISAIM